MPKASGLVQQQSIANAPTTVATASGRHGKRIPARSWADGGDLENDLRMLFCAVIRGAEPASRALSTRGNG